MKNSFNMIFLFFRNTGSCSCSIRSECWPLHRRSPPAACAARSPPGSSGSPSHSSWWSTALPSPPSAPQCWCSCRRPTASSSMTTHSQWGFSSFFFSGKWFTAGTSCCCHGAGCTYTVQDSDLWIRSVKYPPDGEFLSEADEILPVAA